MSIRPLGRCPSCGSTAKPIHVKTLSIEDDGTTRRRRICSECSARFVEVLDAQVEPEVLLPNLGIKARIDAGETAQGVLGNKRAVKGYRAIAGNLAGFDKLVGDIAGSQGALASRDFIGNDPLTTAASLKEAALGRDAASLLGNGSEKKLLLDALAAELKASGGGLNRWATSLETGVVGFLGTENIHFRDVLSKDRDVLSPQLVTAIESYLERIASSNERMENNLAPTSTRQE